MVAASAQPARPSASSPVAEDVRHDARHARRRRSGRWARSTSQLAQKARESNSVHAGRGERLGVAGPAEPLVALRAVGRDGDEVVPLRPADVLVEPGQRRRRSSRTSPAAAVSLLIASDLGRDHLGARCVTSAYRKPWKVNDGSSDGLAVVGQHVACRSPWPSAASGCAGRRPAPAPRRAARSRCRRPAADGRAGRRRRRSGRRRARIGAVRARPSARAGRSRRPGPAGPPAAAGSAGSSGTTAAGAQPESSKPGPVPARLARAAGRPRSRRTGRRSGSRRSTARQVPSVADRDRGAVGELDLELGEQADLPAVPAAVLLRVPAEPAAVPAVAEHGRRARSSPAASRSVTSWLVTSSRCRVRGPARVEQVVADPGAVEPHLVHAERGDVQPGPARARPGRSNAVRSSGDGACSRAPGVVGQGDRDGPPVRRRRAGRPRPWPAAPVRPARVRGRPGPAGAAPPGCAAGRPARPRRAGRRRRRARCAATSRPNAGVGDGLDLVADLAVGGGRGHRPVDPQRTAAGHPGRGRADGQRRDRRPGVGRGRAAGRSRRSPLRCVARSRGRQVRPAPGRPY